MPIICKCDLCNNNMPIPDNFNDSNRQLDLTIKSDGFYKSTYEYVCEICLRKIRDTITNIKHNNIESNVELRNKTFKEYQGRFSNTPQKINAIKYLRSETGMGLKETKDMVEKWAEIYHWDSSNPLT